MLNAWIDGACEPFNPGGTASYGLVVKRNEQVIHKESKVIGSGAGYSNNVAEYSGLVALLKWFTTTGPNEVLTVHSDSQLLIKQMLGEWQVKQGLYVPYYQEAINIIISHGLGHYLKFQWVHRELNTEADNLSKQCLLAVGIKPRY